MNALTFTLKNPLQFSVNCSALTPDHLANKSASDIANIKVTYGNSTALAGDLFDISGDDAAHVVFKNASNKLDYIGAHMSSGKITVDGNAGAYLGFTMKNGEIHCTGSAESYAACNMVNGLLQVDANVGDFLGAGSEGLRKGMRGGTVIIKGNAGDRVGDQMRRGLILIEGNAGDYCGSRMIAGTIGVWGQVGAYTAFNMHRGTLLLKSAPALHATIQNCGTHTLPYLSLLFKSFKKYNTQFSQLSSQRVQRFVGDAAYKGNGEVLVFNA
ncbi:formylmethanofuran dehydrogenase subunit C [Methylotenera mobilis]|uniref:Formylmethanofuran dehydrogenase subunit C n=1 Tax=Methylotenera mobilis (strain JLW8 / ATCC BAA-1282 / DSM 17540) TaxID=583345 RepID=C6WV18_METML|nr:formylmethanofuran dehydrogenase subunit C [Methylotenera mobilis]ACT47767.1 formylmethanofuran dehydrogenase subunit C [Methylotenera mobilis JLW8]